MPNYHLINIIIEGQFLVNFLTCISIGYKILTMIQLEKEIRKDAPLKSTIRQIKSILKKNKIKFKEKGFKCLNGFFSGRIALDDCIGTNGKGITKSQAKASAYAELIERLQSNMLYRKTKEKKPHIINRNNKYINIILKTASQQFKEEFYKLDDTYFFEDEFEDLLSKQVEKLPISVINYACHTNGLAAGNSKDEACVQAICEVLERYLYKKILSCNVSTKIVIDYEKILTQNNKKILGIICKEGYKFEVRYCTDFCYPVIAFVLYNKEHTKYMFTLASDINFNIALQRAITEMFQGRNIKNINNQMLDKNLNIEELANIYKYDYYSYNWLLCFNYNCGLIPKSAFSLEKVSFEDLSFNNYINSNTKALEWLKSRIDSHIYVKDYNVLGFDTVRVYIPGLSEIDNFDQCDLIISKNKEKLKNIFLDILNQSDENINFFLDNIWELCKHIKYQNLILPKNFFKVEGTTKYFQLSFTSLAIILSAIVKRKKELIDLLQFQIDNFPLSLKARENNLYIISLLQDQPLTLKNKNLKNYYKNLFLNPKKYLKSLNPKVKIIESRLFNKI